MRVCVCACVRVWVCVCVLRVLVPGVLQHPTVEDLDLGRQLHSAKASDLSGPRIEGSACCILVFFRVGVSILLPAFLAEAQGLEPGSSPRCRACCSSPPSWGSRAAPRKCPEAPVPRAPWLPVLFAKLGLLWGPSFRVPRILEGFRGSSETLGPGPGLLNFVNSVRRGGSSWRPVEGFDARRVRMPWQASTWRLGLNDGATGR